jgi:hypothetical protein
LGRPISSRHARSELLVEIFTEKFNISNTHLYVLTSWNVLTGIRIVSNAREVDLALLALLTVVDADTSLPSITLENALTLRSVVEYCVRRIQDADGIAATLEQGRQGELDLIGANVDI